MTDRYKTGLPVLVRTTRADYDGLANFNTHKPLQRVKIFGADYLKEGSELYKGLRKSVGPAWPIWEAATQLRAAHTTGDKYEINTAFRKLIVASAPDRQDTRDMQARARIAELWAHPSWSGRAAPFNLPREFSVAMESARLVLWWNNRQKRFLPAIFCPDYKTALFVRAALGDLRACPDCDKPFIPDRPDQEYCSSPCRERHRQRRRRAKQRHAPVSGDRHSTPKSAE